MDFHPMLKVIYCSMPLEVASNLLVPVVPTAADKLLSSACYWSTFGLPEDAIFLCLSRISRDYINIDT